MPLSSHIFTVKVLPIETVELEGVRYIDADDAADECSHTNKGAAAISKTGKIRSKRFTINIIISYQSA